MRSIFNNQICYIMRKIEILNRLEKFEDIERYNLEKIARQLIPKEGEKMLESRYAEIQISIKIYESDEPLGS